MRRYKKRSTFDTLLRALVPYTKENLMLTYKPATFFNELENKSGSTRHSLESAMSRAINKGYVVRDGGVPILTPKGEERIGRVYEGEKMKAGNYFLVVYDIPTKFDYQRRTFARELRALGFKQYQKSFWLSDVNYSVLILEIATELKVAKYVTLGAFSRTFGYPLADKHE